MTTEDQEANTPGEDGGPLAREIAEDPAATAERDAAEERAEGEAVYRAWISRLAAAHEAEPTVPDRRGGAPGDPYEL